MTARLRLDPQDPLPLYAQLERAIKGAVATGALKQGEQLPTVRKLAVDLKVNANTVARVYADLEQQGVLSTRRGVGTFVEGLPAAHRQRSAARRQEQLQALVDRFLAEAATRGFAAGEVLEVLQRIGSSSQEKVQ